MNLEKAMKSSYRLFAGACLLALTSLLHAQSAPEPDVALDEPVAEARKYSVEIIIFKYNEDVSVGTEIFVPELLQEEYAEGPVFDDSMLAPEDELDAEEPVIAEITPLPSEQFAMKDAWGLLTRLQAYEPLMHFGWVQATLPDIETPPFPLARFAAPPEGLSGTLSLNLSRYLHLAVDLSLAATDAPAASTATTGYAIDVAGQRRLDYAPLQYTLVDKRIMKTGEVRYFDHPKFGVIARVDRVETTD